MVDFTRADCKHDDGEMEVNYDLAVKQGLNKRTVETIRQLQMVRRELNTLIRVVPQKWARFWDQHYHTLTRLEFALQRLWGFTQDARYHPHRKELKYYQRHYRDCYWG